MTISGNYQDRFEQAEFNLDEELEMETTNDDLNTHVVEWVTYTPKSDSRSDSRSNTPKSDWYQDIKSMIED